jgi:hypothetical protein
MKSVIYAVATIACLAGAPSVATAQDVRIGVDRPHDYDRPYFRHRHEGCRDVTIRERHGGEMVVRHIRRCD